MIFYVESLQNKRSANEDSYCHMEIRMNHEAKVCAFAIADGMGGLDAGKQYSKKAISLWFQELVGVLMEEQFRECNLQTQIETLTDFSENIFHNINKTLYQKGMDAGIKGGTTLTTAIHFWDTWIIGNCGDSPVYVRTEEGLQLCSEIQNVAWKLVREKKTQIGSTVFYQNKNKLLEYLGRREDVHPFITTMNDAGIQSMILGTDGAFGDLSEEKMNDIMKRTKDSSQVITRILEFARNQGEMDNQTAIYVLSEEKKEKKNGNAFFSFLPEDNKGMVVESTEETKGTFAENEVTCYRTIQEEPLEHRFFHFFREKNNRKGKKGGSGS